MKEENCKRAGMKVVNYDRKTESSPNQVHKFNGKFTTFIKGSEMTSQAGMVETLFLFCFFFLDTLKYSRTSRIFLLSLFLNKAKIKLRTVILQPGGSESCH